MLKLRMALLVMVNLCGAVYAAEQRCEDISYKEFVVESSKWKGRELVAFASWCSSCKAKIIEASKQSEKYVFVAAFDDRAPAEKVLQKFGVTSPCLSGDDLVEGLGVSVLPWTKKL